MQRASFASDSLKRSRYIVFFGVVNKIKINHQDTTTDYLLESIGLVEV